ncbi:MAG: MBL fold metallo-hydrolase, partial [Undibacterium sp.]|nr:MBL fold metallo-hydrolase [Undibacterium sp.]
MTLTSQSRLFFAVLASFSISACTISSRTSIPSTLGQSSSSLVMEAHLDDAGPIQLESVNSADWSVSLGGLVNLKNPEAQAVHLQDKEEAVQVYAHILHHPRYGYFLIDTGVSEKLVQDPAGVGLSWMMRKGMNIEKMHLRESTSTILKRLPQKLSGVFFTHLHLDHISGMPDIDNDVPLYVGAGETSESAWLNMFVQASTDRLLANKA